ncbi:MAG: D-alanine--D-alanine ligase family protein [Thermoplasmatota archaeon]
MTTPVPLGLHEAIQVGRRLKDDVAIILVVNVKGKTTPPTDYETTSVDTEFLSETELDELVSSFKGAGYYVETLLNEERFIEWISTDGPRRIPRKHLAVYNLAQNGTGPARLSMVAALANLNGLTLLDSDAYGVTITQHKFHASSLLAHFGLPAAKSWQFDARGWWPQRPPEGAKLLAKPTFESASIGIGADSVFALDAAAEKRLLAKVAMLRQPLTVQEFVPGYEVEVPVFESDGPIAPLAVGISLGTQRRLGERILGYDDVYRDAYGFYDFAEENPSAATKLRSIAVEAFRAMGMHTAGRVDFRVRPDGKPVIIEVACKPHLTKHSSCAFSLAHTGHSHEDLMRLLVGSLALRKGWTSVSGPELDV